MIPAIRVQVVSLNIIDLTSLFLLAQDEVPAIPFPLIILALGALFYFIVIRPESTKRKAQQALIDGVKKNDRVVTIGGIRGTVASVNRDADEVVIKVDESTGTKIRLSISSIATVVTDSADNDKAGKS